MAERQESRLKRNLTFWNLMGVAIGQIIGAGIMTMTGTAIGMTGTGVVLAFMISPVLTLITDFPQGILSSCAPAVGGPYKYVSRLLDKRFGFLYIVLFIISSSTLSLYALSFASYFVSLFTGMSQIFIAAVILTVLFVVNIIGTKQAAVVNTIICAVMTGAILAFAAFGLPKADFPYIFQTGHLFYKGIPNFMAALALLSFATGGASVICQMGGEAENPGRDIPLVMIISTVLVGIMYVLVALVAVGVFPIDKVADQNLTIVAFEVLPRPVYYVFVIGAALGATSSTLNAQLSWVTKPLIVACEDGLLPQSLATVTERGVAWKILTVFYVLGMGPILTGFDLGFISKLSTSVSLLQKVLVLASLWFLASKYPQCAGRTKLKIPVSLYKPWSVFGAVTAVVLASSLLASMPKQSVALLLGLLAVSWVYACAGLKKKEIPQDLDVDYIGGDQKKKEPEK